MIHIVDDCSLERFLQGSVGGLVRVHSARDVRNRPFLRSAARFRPCVTRNDYLKSVTSDVSRPVSPAQAFHTWPSVGVSSKPLSDGSKTVWEETWDSFWI